LNIHGCLIGILAAALWCAPAAGQPSRTPVAVHLAAGAGIRPNIGGASMGGGGHWSLGVAYGRLSVRGRFDNSILTTGFDTAVSTVTRPRDSRYYWDESVNRCRDRTNGQFASSSLCGTVTVRDTLIEPIEERSYGAGVEVAAAVLDARPSLSLGAGAMLRDGVAPYALATFTLAQRQGSHFFIVATLGRRDMTGAEIGYSFRLWARR
jgi:hypothetical protein